MMKKYENMKMEEGKDWGGAWKTGYFNSKPAFGGL